MQGELFKLGPDLDPLQGLNEIDWTAVHCAYGPSTEVPDQIRGLLAASGEQREHAASELYNTVCHQGTRYPAIRLVVPFLFRLVALKACPDRGQIVWLLGRFAIGYDESWIPEGFPAYDLRTRIKSLDHDENGLNNAAMEAYDAVRAGIPILIPLLGEHDLAVRCQASYALAWFPEHAGELVPELLNVAVQDDDQTIAATALISAGLVVTPDFTTLIMPQLERLRPRSPLLRLAAAIVYARLARSAAPAWVANELCDWVSGKSRVSNHGVPFLHGDLQGYAAASLLQGGEAWLDQATDAMLRRLGTVTGSESLNLLSSLLASTFPDGKLADGSSFHSLTDRQKRVVRALVQAPKAWQYDGVEFGNVLLLIGDYGLPSTLPKLRQFAGLEK